MDLARAPRRAARKKGSGYENVTDDSEKSGNSLPTHCQQEFWEI
jgi:hypothetical protein